MTIEQTIKKAIKGGYILDIKWWQSLPKWERNAIFLDPLFWQSLSKAMGWRKKEDIYKSGEVFGKIGIGQIDQWLFEWHSFIDYLAIGKTPEEFFKNL